MTLDGVLLCILTLGSFYGIAYVGLAPRDPMTGVGVIFAPWVSPAAALERASAAGGRIVRMGGLSSIVVVMPDRPDYPSKIMRTGALMVIDPGMLEACLKVLAR